MATPVSSLASALENATQRLQLISDSPRLDAELLFGHSLGLSRAQLFTRDNDTLDAESVNACEKLIQQREQGQPLAYILGKREFWSLELSVNENTLIPRPETELLIELALTLINKEDVYRIADLGTGSGAIALAIAKEFTHSHIDGCDKSSGALSVAKHNAQQLGISNVEFIESDWFKNLAQKKYDLIVSNPPYVASDDKHLQQGDVRFEPKTALSAEDNGYANLFHIAEHAKNHLTNHGILLFEHGYNQQDKLIRKLESLGYQHVTGHNDYAQQPRAVSAKWMND